LHTYSIEFYLIIWKYKIKRKVFIILKIRYWHYHAIVVHYIYCNYFNPREENSRLHAGALRYLEAAAWLFLCKRHYIECCMQMQLRVGRYFVGSSRYTRELSVANPIYRSRNNVGAGVLSSGAGGAGPLINTILTKSQRRCINHGYVETVAPSEEICGCAIIRAWICRSVSMYCIYGMFLK